MRSFLIPAVVRDSIKGRRRSPFGTGRVMSHISMQALSLPLANCKSGGRPIGAANAAWTAAAGLCNRGAGGFFMTVTSNGGGRFTGKVPRP